MQANREQIPRGRQEASQLSRWIKICACTVRPCRSSNVQNFLSLPRRKECAGAVIAIESLSQHSSLLQVEDESDAPFPCKINRFCHFSIHPTCRVGGAGSVQ